MKKNTALATIGIFALLCIVLLTVMFWPKKEVVVEPEVNVTPPSVEEEIDTPIDTEESPDAATDTQPVTEDDKFTQILNNPSNPPDIIESPEEWDGWKIKVRIGVFEGVEVPSTTLSFLCDVAGCGYPEESETFRQYVATVGNALGIDVSSAEAGDPSSFPSVVRGSIPVHITVSGTTYYSFVKDGVAYIFGAIDTEQ